MNTAQRERVVKLAQNQAWEPQQHFDSDTQQGEQYSNTS